MEEKNITAEEKEILELEQNEAEEGITISRYAFNAFRIERSIRDILSWVEKGKIIIPEFQRDFVWNFNQCSKFIESILLGLPIPDFFMFRLLDPIEHTEKYILIDGLQRYTTIKQFVDGKYVQEENERIFKINNKSSQWFGKTYEKLEETDKDYFKDYSLKINVFDSVEDSENMQRLYMTEIFERINTGSSKLSNQEVRNAIYAGPATDMIKETSKNNLFLDLLNNDKKTYLQRCKNQEFFIRLLTYFYIYNKIKDIDLEDKTQKLLFAPDYDSNTKITSSKDVMLCEYLYHSNKSHIDYVKDINIILQVIERINTFNKVAFCTVKREEDAISTKVHEVFSEALVIALADGSDIKIEAQNFDTIKIKLWREQENYSEFFSATTNLKNVKQRVIVMKKILSGEM